MLRLPGLDKAESQGFSVVLQGRLSRNPRRMIIADYPVLQQFSTSGLRNLEGAAFAAELLKLGYSYEVIAKNAKCGLQTIAKIKRRMIRNKVLPEFCDCGREFYHSGNCRGTNGWTKREHGDSQVGTA